MQVRANKWTLPPSVTTFLLASSCVGVCLFFLISFVNGIISSLTFYLFLFALLFCVAFIVVRDKYLFIYGALIVLSTVASDYPLTSEAMISGGARPGFTVWVVDILLFPLLFYEIVIRRGHKIVFPSIGKCLIALIVWQLISAIFSDYFVNGIFQCLQDFRVLLFFLLIFNFINTKRKFEIAVKCIFVFMLFHSLIGFASWIMGGKILGVSLGYLGGERAGSEMSVYSKFGIEGNMFGIPIGSFASSLTGGRYVFAVFLYTWL